MWTEGDRGERTEVVRLDHGTLRGRPSGACTRYTIGLDGQTNDRWLEAFGSLQLESPAFRQFQLDRASSTVVFSCPTVEGPTLVLEMLEKLEALLELTDRRLEASRWQASSLAEILPRRPFVP